MSRVDLENQVDDILSDESSVACLYAILFNNNKYKIKEIEVDPDIQSSIKDLFNSSLRDSYIFNSDAVLKNLTECDDRKNIICKVDCDLGESFNMLSNLDGLDSVNEVFNR
ncbi:hypothetical protein [Acinetobacter portensis]|uniref:hypothetical protein n=1 Tax=Acinetobacter portensis TaxID=1839785 RepID=UPI0013D30CC9|nr:hypothetical protein [Acinetobacter portensis]